MKRLGWSGLMALLLLVTTFTGMVVGEWSGYRRGVAECKEKCDPREVVSKMGDLQLGAILLQRMLARGNAATTSDVACWEQRP